MISIRLRDTETYLERPKIVVSRVREAPDPIPLKVEIRPRKIPVPCLAAPRSR